MFCADLKKFQNLKETLHQKKPKKEEDDEGERMVACKKTKIKTEENGTVKNRKTKSACHKSTKKAVTDEKVM